MMSRFSMTARAFTPVALAVALAVACGSGSSDVLGPPDPGPGGPGPSETENPTHPAGTLSGKVLITDAPHGIDVSSAGAVYVTRLYSPSVARFLVDAPASLLPSINLPTELSDVAFNRAGTVAYVGGPAGADSRIYAIDVASGTVKFTLPVGSSPYHLTLSLDDSRVFAAASQSRVWSAPAAGGTATAAVLTGAMEGVAVSPSGGGLFAANQNGIVRRLDPSSLLVQESSAPIGLLGDLAVSPDGAQVYVVTDVGVVVLATSTLAPIGSVTVGNGAGGMAMSPDGQQLYVTTFFGELAIVDAVRLAVVKRIVLGGTPAHVAFDRLGRTAVVANENGWVDIIK
jgi:DNA-binding beta-propeller fold protein YncE